MDFPGEFGAFLQALVEYCRTIADAGIPAGMGHAAAAAWSWWAGLVDLYAWRDIGAFVVPVLVIVVVTMFRAITRLHLRG